MRIQTYSKLVAVVHVLVLWLYELRPRWLSDHNLFTPTSFLVVSTEKEKEKEKEYICIKSVSTYFKVWYCTART